MSNTLYCSNEFGIDSNWAIGRRKEFLELENNSYNQSIREATSLMPGLNELSRYLLINTMKHFDELVKKNEKELKYIDTQPSINDIDIMKARNYPIEQLFDNAYKGKVNCVNHEDNDPSMDIRNNFAYCYSCGWTGDAISAYMKIHNVGFKAAVEFLSK